MSQPDFEAAIAYAIDRLRSKLPAHLTYHNLWHTQSDVMPAVERLARLERVDEEEMMLLRVAAAFHDVGYVCHPNEHEIVSARIAAQVLPQYGFSPGQIETIMGMIVATRLPQMPRNPLEEIIVDADLDTLGRDDFAKRSEDLRQELLALGQSISNGQWQQQQLNFLKVHNFFTQAARELRGETKRKNIAMMEERLRQHS